MDTENKSQHRKLTLEKKNLSPLLQGFEPATFQSRVWHSNHWAIPLPKVLRGCFYVPRTNCHSFIRLFLRAMCSGKSAVGASHDAIWEPAPLQAPCGRGASHGADPAEHGGWWHHPLLTDWGSWGPDQHLVADVRTAGDLLQVHAGSG